MTINNPYWDAVAAYVEPDDFGRLTVDWWKCLGDRRTDAPDRDEIVRRYACTITDPDSGFCRKPLRDDVGVQSVFLLRHRSGGQSPCVGSPPSDARAT
jgi:hypothetical protein